jgi:hypothetical protein
VFSKIEPSFLDVGYWILDVSWILDIGYWMLNVGLFIGGFPKDSYGEALKATLPLDKAQTFL